MNGSGPRRDGPEVVSGTVASARPEVGDLRRPGDGRPVAQVLREGLVGQPGAEEVRVPRALHLAAGPARHAGDGADATGAGLAHVAPHRPAAEAEVAGFV